MLPDSEDSCRYAIYFVPSAETDLFRFAAQWLGRDVETNAQKPRPAVGDLAWHEIEAITDAPNFYGFHATLKPPFVLADGCDEDSLTKGVRNFCNKRHAFRLPPLKVEVLGGFIALLLSGSCFEMTELAASCVRELDTYRAPAKPEEAEKRRKSGLNIRQEEMLTRWGYPYVMDEFRFHMTLTKRLQEPSRVREALAAFFAPYVSQSLTVDGVAICMQHNRNSAFRILERVPFQS